ncbi:MAG TPA: hypothetical protein VH372_16005 [Actinospica sp.]|jgi:hypothetical protein|nr:hypothetical protein [Actinospica sp.]
MNEANGTHSRNDTQPYTVFGYWEDSDERFGEVFEASSAQDAERRMQRRSANEGGGFRAAATLRGRHGAADTYSAFVDPEDSRNLERGLEPVIAELELTEYTVLGLTVSTRRRDEDWNARTGGRRVLFHELALSPRIAEDVAAARVRDEGDFRLVVCAVLTGHRERAESFAFSDIDEAVAR